MIEMTEMIKKKGGSRGERSHRAVGVPSGRLYNGGTESSEFCKHKVAIVAGVQRVSRKQELTWQVRTLRATVNTETLILRARESHWRASLMHDSICSFFPPPRLSSKPRLSQPQHW